MIDPAVETACTHDARVVGPTTPVPEAAELLRDPDVPVLVVRDEGDAIVGVVTESDVVALVAETTDLETVGKCMSSPVTTVRPGTTVSEAAARMRRAGVKHLPVVDDGVYHGVVSTATLAPYCSRRAVDVEWSDDPLTVDATESTGVPAHE